MKTFFNILQTQIGIKNKIYPDEIFECQKQDYIDPKNEEYIHTLQLMHNIHYIFITATATNNANFAFSKFTALNAILENSFYKDGLKEKIMTRFSKIQKHYNAFVRFAHIYKIKRNPYVVTNDLTLNPLVCNHRLTFVLVENKSNYLFNINEIINIIETAIGYSPNFFSQPLWPLNPYNNQKMSISTLYNIYFQIKNSGRIIPLLFHLFFLEKFDTKKFSQQYELIIRENAIKKHVFNSPYAIIYNSVVSMLKNNKYTRRLVIHSDFPKNLLVNIFRPYLFYFYIVNYLDQTAKYYNAKYVLYNKLKRFYKYNKLFGRKIYKLTTKDNKIKIKEFIINTKHLSFHNDDNTGKQMFNDNNGETSDEDEN